MESESPAAAALVAMRSGLAMFCIATAAITAVTLPTMVRYYTWFRDSGLEIARHRGYGQAANKFYGVIPAPPLPTGAMAAAGAGFIATLLLAAAAPACVAMPALLGAFVMYHLYFSQLYCEAHVGAHVTVLIPPTLLLTALSAGLGEGSSELHARAAAFTAWMLKLVITFAYCGAGVSKIVSSWSRGRAWWDGATLQAYIFEAMFVERPGHAVHTSFGLPTPFSHRLKQIFVRHPQLLLAPMGAYSVVLEALAPLVLLLPPALASMPFAVLGISFHYGIALLQNIDFVTWWGPCYGPAFLFDPAAAACAAGATSGYGLLASAAASLEVAPLRTIIALTYVTLHVGCVVGLRLLPAGTLDVLPFSPFQMYCGVLDLFDDSYRKWVYLTDKPHATGTLKNYCFPKLARPHTVLPEELHLLPFKYLLLGHSGPGEPVLLSNVDVTPNLRAALEELKAACAQGKGAYRSKAAIDRAVSALNRAKEAFDGAPRTETRKEAAEEAPRGLKQPLLDHAGAPIPDSCMGA